MARARPVIHQSTLKIGIEGDRDFSPENREVSPQRNQEANAKSFLHNLQFVCTCGNHRPPPPPPYFAADSGFRKRRLLVGLLVSPWVSRFSPNIHVMSTVQVATSAEKKKQRTAEHSCKKYQRLISWTKSLKSFPPCYSQSPLQLCSEISISSISPSNLNSV